MLARQGSRVILDARHTSCPAAAAALGFNSLAPKLKDRSMLNGYGIFSTIDAAVSVMESMPRLPQGKFAAVENAPLMESDCRPDVVVIEDQAERLMWIALASLQNAGGRLCSETSVLQVVCVASIVVPFMRHRLNISFGCSGCRDATDAGTGEEVLGIPGTELSKIVEGLRFLNGKAIDRSREKNVHAAFRRRLGDGHVR